MLSEQIKELRDFGKNRKLDVFSYDEVGKILNKAADTIEELSAKLAEANTERSTANCCGGWIPCSERLPEEGQRVLATHKGGLNPDLQVIEHIFKNGEFIGNWDMDTDFKSSFGQRYMGDVVAWQPLPEAFKLSG